MAELVICVKTALFEGLSELTQVQNMFAKSAIPANLKNLLSKLLLEKLPFFNKKLADEQSNYSSFYLLSSSIHQLIMWPSCSLMCSSFCLSIVAMLPKLVDFNWRVDIKMASNMSGGDAITKSGQQACILQLKVCRLFFAGSMSLVIHPFQYKCELKRSIFSSPWRQSILDHWSRFTTQPVHPSIRRQWCFYA